MKKMRLELNLKGSMEEKGHKRQRDIMTSMEKVSNDFEAAFNCKLLIAKIKGDQKTSSIFELEIDPFHGTFLHT